MQKAPHPALESHLSRRLKNSDLNAQLAIAAEELALLGARFSPDAVEIIRSALSRTRRVNADLQGWFEGQPPTANLRRLKALLASDLLWTEAPEIWRDFLATQPSTEPADRLQYARVLADSGEYSGAAVQLRRMLSVPLAYPTFARAEKLIERVAKQDRAYSRETKVAILGQTTTAFLAPVLKALCFRDRVRVDFYEGQYGSQQQELLTPDSGVARFHPDILILPLSWRDLKLPAAQDTPEALVASFLEQRRQLWNQAAERFGCHIVQFAPDFPLSEAYGPLARTLPGGRTRLIEMIGAALSENTPGFVSVLDTAALQRLLGSSWEDPAQWASYQQHPASPALPELAEALVAHIRAVLGLTRKVLVTDLDNTLWQGVIGEDGLDRIRVGPGSPAGEAHHALQLYLKELRSRGVLLAVSSKNNPEDARLPFQRHDGMALKLDDFAAFRANWDDKAANIRAIAAELSLGLDSFVFLDDNPIEREWVASQIPELTVVELGGSVFHWVRDLDRGRYFESLAISEEDLARSERYRQQSSRESLRSAYASLDEFLQQLNLEASVEPIEASNLSRVAQLVNKTNQFNFTARRYTEAQVSTLAANPEGWAAAFQMSDRFGSYGLIGVLICRPSGPHTWEIDSWLMSCRTLGRQMERFMFDRLIDAARGRGIRTLIGVYRPTAKNRMVSGLYEELGFRRVEQSAEEVRFELQVSAAPAQTAPHVRDVSPSRFTPELQAK